MFYLLLPFPRIMSAKIKEWLKRYLPAELLSVGATLAGGWLAFALTGNQLAVALAATWAGNVAYFGYIIAADLRKTYRQCRQRLVPFSAGHLWHNLKALCIEFGVAEIADSFFIRPALLYYLPQLTGNLTTGLVLAKLAADVTFYVPAIIGYELSKRHLKPAPPQK